MAITEEVRTTAFPLGQPGDFEPLFDRAEGVQIAAIGENSHGGHEDVECRIELTKGLIERGFKDVAIEADQEICGSLDKLVRHTPLGPDDPKDLTEALTGYKRWPSWLIANAEVLEFCHWLQEHNRDKPAESRVGIHGLDGYSLWGAMEIFVTHLSDLGWSRGQVKNAFEAPLRGQSMVSDDLIEPVATRIAGEDPTPKAIIYYKELLKGGDAAMRARAYHWLGRLGAIQSQRKDKSRIIVWAHNTHVGDNLGTNVSHESIGQLSREHYGSNKVLLIGQIGCSGEVTASLVRGDQPISVPVSSPKPESLDELMTQGLGSNEQTLHIFSEEGCGDWVVAPRPQRAIGAVHNPNSQHDYYVFTTPAKRYNAIISRRKITPIRPLHF